MDAIALLKADHREVERLFKAFEKTGDRARTAKADLVKKIVRALSLHTYVEEHDLYPVVRADVAQASEYVLDSLEEHDVVARLCSELGRMRPDHERFDAKVRVLIETVRYHVKGEERELFPAVRDALGLARLRDLGARMERARHLAPTHSRRRAADTQPGNVLAGMVVGAVDKARDAGKRVFDEARHLAS